MRKIVGFLRKKGFPIYYFPHESVPNFKAKDCGYNPHQSIKCERCEKIAKNEDTIVMRVDDNYADIINQLKEAGLLSKDYTLMCCRCFWEASLE